MMRKIAIPLLLMISISCGILPVNLQQRTRNPFAVGFQFDRFYYEPNSSGSLRIWFVSWVETPIYVESVFVHFDWMEENETIGLLGLNRSLKYQEPVIGGVLNFTVPDVEPGWHGFYAIAYYSANVSGRWIKGRVIAPDPYDEPEFGHIMYLFPVGYPAGGGEPTLIWEVRDYTEKVRRGEYLEITVDLGNAGGGFVPSMRALLMNDLGVVVTGIQAKDLSAASGIRGKLVWRIPENYSLGLHRFTVVIVSGEIYQDSKLVNITVLKSYSEEAEEKLGIIREFLSEIKEFLNASGEIGYEVEGIDLASISDEYDQGMVALHTGDEKLALEHANEGIRLVNLTREKLDPLLKRANEEISELNSSKNSAAREHLKKAKTALELAEISENPVHWAANATIALSELLQAKKMAGGWKINQFLVIALVFAAVVAIFLMRRSLA
ncbi:MAG: hypothetical protein DRO05_00730 [Thermoproteota archaeon]|nr:MAG: hypothetical protein DRO05_00730 [Candidatus Korarchaeota archaeon]